MVSSEIPCFLVALYPFLILCNLGTKWASPSWDTSNPACFRKFSTNTNGQYDVPVLAIITSFSCLCWSHLEISKHICSYSSKMETFFRVTDESSLVLKKPENPSRITTIVFICSTLSGPHRYASTTSLTMSIGNASLLLTLPPHKCNALLRMPILLTNFR